jgi:probable F420-dependent oxidoreductase
MRIGIVFPTTEIEADAGALKEWAQSVERMGFDHAVLYDHVVGANRASRPGAFLPYDIDDAFYEPFTLIPYFAAVTTALGFFTSVLILPQRQTVLVAKQAACVDVLSNGRLRLGIGTGWNQVEYEALGVPWAERGPVFEDQVAVLRALWTTRAVTLKTNHHTLTDVGLLPMPIQQPIPLWFGGGGREPLSGKPSPERVLRRIARLADGLAVAALRPDEEAAEMLDRFRRFCREYGRDPASIGAQAHHTVTPDTLDRCGEQVEAWQALGATHVGINTMRGGLRGCEAHLLAAEQIAKGLSLRD